MSHKPTNAIIDLDFVKYAAASVGEKRSVVITHKTTGRTFNLPTRAEFYGSKRSRDGGLLGDLNEHRESPWTWDEFEYVDLQEPEPIENTLQVAKTMVESALVKSGAKSHKGFLGEGDSFRLGLSTLLKYKDRDHLIKPLALKEVQDYLERKYDAEVVTGIECDDRVVMECYKQKNNFAIAVDKDYWGQPINMFDLNQTNREIVNCHKFGGLHLDSKGKVRGEGRMFFYLQVCSSDTSDNYAANCFSDTRWGEKSAYKKLVSAENDEQAIKAAVDIFKTLYPEPKVVKGWRGDEFIHLDIYTNKFGMIFECWDKFGFY